MQNRIACQECDLLHEFTPVPEGATAYCARCGAVLYRRIANALDRTLAMALTGLILFVIANSFPFLTMQKVGQVREATLATGIIELYGQEMWLLATFVLLTALLLPFLELCALLYIFLPFKFGRRPWQLARAWRGLDLIKSWSMMEVFMLGILVSLVKLAKLSTITPGIAVYAFGGLIVVLAAASASLDPELVWSALEEQ